MTPLLVCLIAVGCAVGGCASEPSAPSPASKDGQSAPTADENDDVKSVAEVENLLERHAQAAPRFVPGEIIVKPKAGRGEMAASALGFEGVKRKTSGGEVIYKISSTPAAMAEPRAAKDQIMATVKSLQERPDVEYAQPNWIKRIVQDPSDRWYKRQWHYRNNDTAPGGINLPKMWEITKGKKDIVVAVIDTGIFGKHADIAGSPNLIKGYDMITEPEIANDGDGRDADATDPGDAVKADECGPGVPEMSSSWHGTHVAGTIGVVRTDNGKGVAGINWNVSVLPVRVLGKCGGTTTDINDAIRWAAGLDVPGVPKNQHPARVINMSLGGEAPCSDDPATQSAIRDAVAAGVTVVVAAGNNAADASGFSPASCEDVITVAASDFRGHLVTRYSNFGDTVEIMAPGGDVRRDDNNDGKPDGVYSTVKGGYAYYNGTSMAAPHVAGVAALLLAAEPDLELPAQVLARLQHDAIPRNSTQCPKPCGAGLLSAFHAGPTPAHLETPMEMGQRQNLPR
jgi:serine protease